MPSTHAYRIAAVFLVWLILRGLVPSHAQTEEGRIYWADMEGIYSSSLEEGTTQRIITAETRRPGRIAVDAAGGKIYWVDRRGETIWWSDLDGTNSEQLPGDWGGSGAIDIALDLERGEIYSLGLYDGGDYEWAEVHRANLDGSDFEVLGETLPAEYLALDTARGHVYLGVWSGIFRLDRSSWDWEVVLQTSSRPLALERIGNKLYWTDGSIWRSNPDGSDLELVLQTGSAGPAGAIALDPEEGKVYWAVRDDSRPGLSGIGPHLPRCYGELLRANLDGSEVEYVVREGEVVAFDLDLQGRKIYWTDARGTIHRANVDGTGVEDLFTPTVRAPYSVALDPGDGRIYWSDVLVGSIQRAGADGSSPEILVGELKSPRGIFLDVDRLYWADSGTGKIQAADLDGSNVMDIAAELEDPDKLAVDPAHRIIYWTEPGRSLIRRADLDGTRIEDFPVAPAPNGIALDVAGGKMYWTWKEGPRGRYHGPTGISRSGLDGSDVENLYGDIDYVDVFGDLVGHDFRTVALDPAGGKIYWTSVDFPVLGGVTYSPWAYRSNLDGSGAERLARLSSHIGRQQQGLKVWPPLFMANSLALDLSHRTAVSAPNSAPGSTTLRRNHPNPFNGSTLISYTLAAPGPVSLVVYNTLGQPVRTLVDKVQAPGLYSVPWQPAESLASGVYLYRLTTSDGVLTRRLTLLR